MLYEAPHRLAETLADALDRLGRRPAVIARELTKIHEEFLRGDLAELVVRMRPAARARRNHAADRSGRMPGDRPLACGNADPAPWKSASSRSCARKPSTGKPR